MSRDLSGKTAGGFRLGEILARGASSTVYAAEPTAGGPAVDATLPGVLTPPRDAPGPV